MEKARKKYLLNIFLILALAMVMGLSAGTALGKYVFSQDVGTFDLVIKPPIKETPTVTEQEPSTNSEDVEKGNIINDEETDTLKQDGDIINPTSEEHSAEKVREVPITLENVENGNITNDEEFDTSQHDSDIS